jgi:hypothetical protein
LIFFFAQGRLGNQIFQYSFLKTIQQNNKEKIIVYGFDEIEGCFYVNILSICQRNRVANIIINKFIVKIFDVLANKNIISSYEQKKKEIDGLLMNSTGYIYNKGILKNIKYIKLGFFQSESFFTKSNVPLLKKDFFDQARSFLTPFDKKYKIFVHIRRGDYLKWSVLGNNPLLPIDYFKQQIDWFLKNKTGTHFVFLTDDVQFIENEFSYLANKQISTHCVGVDLAIMTLCNGAILSNSSLSWWGAYLMKDKDKVFMPKHWLGFKNKRWHPDGIKLDFAEIVEVKE